MEPDSLNQDQHDEYWRFQPTYETELDRLLAEGEVLSREIMARVNPMFELGPDDLYIRIR